jgi:hypothetical protein
MDEHAAVRNRGDEIPVDEPTDQILRRRVIDIRRCHTGGVAILGAERGLVLFDVGTHVLVQPEFYVRHGFRAAYDAARGTPLGAKKHAPASPEPSLPPERRYPGFDLVEDESQDITMVGRPGVIVTGRRGGGRGMEVVARIVGVRMPIPSAVPGVLRMDLSIVDSEVVVRVPADSQGCVVDGRWVV